MLGRWVLRRRGNERVEFWFRQGINLLGAVLLLFGAISIWFDDPSRLTTAFGLITAGLAFALQKVITAFAGYVVILRGKTFDVGDRIVMGGVRGDVIALDFTQTSIMEMGQPPPVQRDEPGMWIQSRQYAGRIVTVSNARIFDEPVYNAIGQIAGVSRRRSWNHYAANEWHGCEEHQKSDRECCTDGAPTRIPESSGPHMTQDGIARLRWLLSPVPPAA